MSIAENRSIYDRVKINGEHLNFFRENGYLVIEDALTPQVAIASHDHRDIVMISGNDPYAYKGIENIAFSHIRPNREGRCRWPSTDDN